MADDAPRDVFLIYRHPQAGPLGKRTATLVGTSVLDWFQRAWEKAKAAPSVDGETDDAWLVAELGGEISGLASLFQAVREHDLPAPATIDALFDVLDDHLSIERAFWLDEDALRIDDDDDEVQHATILVGRAYAEANPDRFAFALHEDWKLPDTSARGAFEVPDDVVRLRLPQGAGDGVTHLCFVTFYDSESFANPPPILVPGTRLDGLAARFRELTQTDGWPFELLLLRGLLGGKASDAGAIEPALRDATTLDLMSLGGESSKPAWRDAKASKARASFMKSRADEPADAQIFAGAHVVQLSVTVSETYFHQWVLFDDLWAAANPDLASSLLRWTHRWDVVGDGDDDGRRRRRRALTRGGSRASGAKDTSRRVTHSKGFARGSWSDGSGQGRVGADPAAPGGGERAAHADHRADRSGRSPASGSASPRSAPTRSW